MSKNIFISYRRGGSSSNFTTLLYKHLIDCYSKKQVFKDFEAIEPGDDFVEVIEEALQSCDILLVLIGPSWLSKSKGGTPRIFDEDDFVRREIAIMLAKGRKAKVLPVLFDGAVMPKKTELPEDLHNLTRRQAVEIRIEKFDSDIEPLIAVIDKSLGIERSSVSNEKASKAPTSVSKGDSGGDDKASSPLLWFLLLIALVGLAFFLLTMTNLF